jgi:O-antigen/teichoic acid export membrane protein
MTHQFDEEPAHAAASLRLEDLVIESDTDGPMHRAIITETDRDAAAGRGHQPAAEVALGGWTQRFEGRSVEVVFSRPENPVPEPEPSCSALGHAAWGSGLPPLRDWRTALRDPFSSRAGGPASDASSARPPVAPSMKRAAAHVGGAAIVVAAAGYIAQFLAARWLGPADYAKFAVFWAVLFVIVGSLSGVAQEVIRVSRVVKLRLDQGLPADPGFGRTPRIAVLGATIGACTATVVLLTGLFWGPPTFGADWPFAIALLALAGILVGGALGVGGMVAGLARWRTYSLLVVLEGLARLAFFVAAALFMPTVLGFSIAAVLAFIPGIVVALVRGPLRRESFSIRSDTPVGESTTRMLRAMLASAMASVLVIGWPALLAAASNAHPRGSTASSLGVIILLVTLTRTPIMLPLTSFQNVLIARFTGLDLRGRRRWVASGSGIIAAAGGLFACLAALIGPPLLPVVFGAEYQADAGIVAGLTAATAGLGVITLTGIASITAARHTIYLLGWGTAIVVTLLVLFLVPLPFPWATVLALVAGPLAGAAVHTAALRDPSSSDHGISRRAVGARW